MDMKRKPVIAIDGYSSTGKSSISKQIAAHLGLIHMDTGALYRGITLFGLQNFVNSEGNVDVGLLCKNLHRINLEFREENGTLILFLNGNNVSTEIRSIEVSENVSEVAKKAEVRNFLLETQRAIAEKGGVVMDGRDIGTVVLPNADYKFFLTASVDERTRRRHLELTSCGQNVDSETVKNNLVNRDKIDSERETSPLRMADDAILIDNTSINQQETFDLILSYIKQF